MTTTLSATPNRVKQAIANTIPPMPIMGMHNMQLPGGNPPTRCSPRMKMDEAGHAYVGDSMDNILMRRKLLKKVMPTDGSGLFRSVCEQMTGVQTDFQQLKELVENALTHKYKVLRTRKEAHLISKDRSADLLSETARLIQRNIEVYEDDSQLPKKYLCDGQPDGSSIVLCKTLAGGFETVYKIQDHASLAFSQAITYETVYQKVFGEARNRTKYAVDAIRSDIDAQGVDPHGATIILNEIEELDEESDGKENTSSGISSMESSPNQEPQKKVAISARKRDEKKKNDLAHINIGGMMIRKAPPFPFAACKSLDASIYRNVYFDLFIKKRRDKREMDEQVRTDCYVQFLIGQRVLVHDDSGMIQAGRVTEMMDDNLRKICIESNGINVIHPISEIRLAPPVPTMCMNPSMFMPPLHGMMPPPPFMPKNGNGFTIPPPPMNLRIPPPNFKMPPPPPSPFHPMLPPLPSTPSSAGPVTIPFATQNGSRFPAFIPPNFCVPPPKIIPPTVTNPLSPTVTKENDEIIEMRKQFGADSDNANVINDGGAVQYSYDKPVEKNSNVDPLKRVTANMNNLRIEVPSNSVYDQPSRSEYNDSETDSVFCDNPNESSSFIKIPIPFVVPHIYPSEFTEIQNMLEHANVNMSENKDGSDMHEDPLVRRFFYNLGLEVYRTGTTVSRNGIETRLENVPTNHAITPTNTPVATSSSFSYISQFPSVPPSPISPYIPDIYRQYADPQIEGVVQDGSCASEETMISFLSGSSSLSDFPTNGVETPMEQNSEESPRPPDVPSRKASADIAHSPYYNYMEKIYDDLMRDYD